MLSVLHVAQPTEAGVARYVAALAVDQRSRGWRITVACPRDGWLAVELAGRGVAHLPWRAGRAPGPGSLAEAWRLRRLIEHARPDVVHLHSSKAGLAGRLAVRGRRATLFQPHGWSWLAVTGATARAALAWERMAVRWADAVVCVGEGEAGQAEAAGVAGRRVVVRNGVDLEHFRPAAPVERPAVRAELGLPVRAPLAVCVARLSRQKGQDVLLRAWPAVRRGCPAALLALVGDGPLDGPSPDGVLRVGPVADPRPWLVAADVAVFPSRWEGLCLGLLEAMAVGRSTVVSAIPGLLEVVDHRVGAAVPAGQVGPLADTLLARLADPALAAAEGDAAARRAPAFDVQRTHQRVADLTELALEAHQRPPMSWRSRCAERGLSGHSNTPCGQ